MRQQRQDPKSVAAVKHTAAVKHHEAQGLTQDQRHRMIAEAAYYIAEQRNFQGDMALNDWLRAEAEVRARFAARH